MTPDQSPKMANRPDLHRYELTLHGQVAAHIDYRMQGSDTVDLVHTEVEPAHEGNGLASKIAEFALQDARARGLRVIPSCSYIAGYVRKHPEHEELLAQR